MIEEEELNHYLKAGRIAAEIKKLVPGMVRPGVKCLELAERIEEEIRNRGGEPAFPCNLSMGSEAAHYTPLINDDRVVEENGILKVDFGVHVEGYISDTSISIDLTGEHEDLVKAVEEALEKALSTVGPGVKIRDVSEAISKTIAYYNVRPIRNLTGHSLDRYNLHAGISIPNTPTLTTSGRIKPGTALAIEPFATKGIGLVVDAPIITIYALKNASRKRRLGGPEKQLYTRIYSERRELPFTERWYQNVMDVDKLRGIIGSLYRKKTLTGYPVLEEASGAQVAQAEDSVLVLDKEVIVYTRL